MLRFCLCTLCGALVLHQASRLPSVPWLIALSVIGCGLLLHYRSRCIGGFVFGFVAAAIGGSAVIESRLDERLNGQQLQFVAEIVEFPVISGNTLRFLIAPLTSQELPPRIRLSWYDTAALPQLGEHWLLTARLRSPRGFANPNVFDYEAWLFRQKIGATGYVVSGEPIHVNSDPATTTHLRQRILQRIHSLLPDDPARAVLAAITIGARQSITRAQWDLYARTGTSHLMAISGLHVGLAAAGLYFLGRLFVSMVAPGRATRDIAMVIAACGATGYALISGMAVPAQRALLMILLIFTATLRRRQQSFDRILAFACVALFLSDPLTLYSPGFQLSFMAVAWIYWSARQLPPDLSHVPATRLAAPVCRLTTLQLVLLAGLLPVTVLQFGRIAWLAPLVNVIVLPVFSFATVPLALAAIACDGPLQQAGDALFRLAYTSVELVLHIISVTSNLPHADLQVLPGRGAVSAALWGTALWALLPPGFPGRHIAWVAVLAVLLNKPQVPAAGCADLHVLDVGQGLAVVVQTHSNLLVFDTGPAFRSGSDTAELVIVPFIRSLGRDRVDTLIVSHADLDHAGGIATILQHLEVGEILAGEPLLLETPDRLEPKPCAAGRAWKADGVGFRILHPPPTAARSGNNASCVLEVSAGEFRALLTGDIESPVERSLVALGRLRPAHIVLVPHHGSKTSSSAGFAAAIDPQLAIASTGFANRWGFPRAEVVRRWQNAGATVLSTATSGAIGQRLCASSGASPVTEQRKAYRRYFHAPA